MSANHCQRCPIWILKWVLFFIIAFQLPAAVAEANWPNLPVRSGSSLPQSRQISLSLSVVGAHVPEELAITEHDSALLGGEFVWNFALNQHLGFFGGHHINRLRWDNVTLLYNTNETGFRYRPLRQFAVEGAFLSHRVAKSWIDEFESEPGGVNDIGLELTSWFFGQPIQKLRLEAGLITRYFDVYKDSQRVLGFLGRLSIWTSKRSVLFLATKCLRVVRTQPREGVNKSTVNAIGSIYWHAFFTKRIGIKLGGKVSANLLVGEVPMLELKRSMIGEPMGMAQLGVIFNL